MCITNAQRICIKKDINVKFLFVYFFYVFTSHSTYYKKGLEARFHPKLSKPLVVKGGGNHGSTINTVAAFCALPCPGSFTPGQCYPPTFS